MGAAVRALRTAGFSLLELAVSLVVVGLVLGLAAQLLEETQLAFVSVTREQRSPAPDIAARWLRGDLRAARSLSPDASWVPSSGPLWLFRAEGWVSYQHVEGALVRTAYDASQIPVSRLSFLGDVVEWSWRRPSDDLVEVTVVHQEPLARLLRIRADLGRPKVEVRTLRLIVAQRARGVGW